MSKAAFVILAAGDTGESLGRVMNALMGALEYIENNDEVRIIFDGAGVKAAVALAEENHPYHELFQKVRGKVTGVCSYCAGAFEVNDRIANHNLPLAKTFKEHPSFRELIEQGYHVLTF
jgi:hypothetical protein